MNGRMRAERERERNHERGWADRAGTEGKEGMVRGGGRVEGGGEVWGGGYIYIYAVGGESWPPQGGDLVPSTLPAAEPSILARGKIGI